MLIANVFLLSVEMFPSFISLIRSPWSDHNQFLWDHIEGKPLLNKIGSYNITHKNNTVGLRIFHFFKSIKSLLTVHSFIADHVFILWLCRYYVNKIWKFKKKISKIIFWTSLLVYISVLYEWDLEALIYVEILCKVNSWGVRGLNIHSRLTF